MAEPLRYPAVLDFVALVLGRDPTVLGETLRHDPDRAEAVADELDGSSLARVRLVLTQPLCIAAGEAPLLAAGAKLETKHLRTLLKRQASGPENLLGPLCLEVNSSLLGHFRSLSRKRFEPAVDAARNGGGRGSQLVSQLLPQCSSDTQVEAAVDDAVTSLVANEAFAPLLLRMVSNPDNRSVLESSVNTARVALAVCGEYRRFPSPEERKKGFHILATAALMQDASIMAEPDSSATRHAERAQQLALDAGLGMAVAAAVRDHHRTKTSSGEPVLYSPRSMAEPARILVVANTFLGMADESRNSDGFEAVKSLNHLATNGYVDKPAVDIVSRLFLPKVKSLILARANKIATHCPQGPGAPVLWPVTGDKVPSVFLCNRRGCDELSEQISYLAQNIPFELDGEEITTIRKGTYSICPLLTTRLKELYTLIAQRNRSGGKA